MLDQGGAEGNDGCSHKRQNRRHRCRGEATCGQRQRWEGRGHQPREAWSSRSWETEEVPPAASGRSMTLSRLDLSIPAPPGPQRSCPTWISDVWSTELGGGGWGYISVALGHLVYVAWLRLPLGESHPDYTPSPVQHLRVCVSLCVPICANLSPAVRNMTPIIPVKPVH